MRAIWKPFVEAVGRRKVDNWVPPVMLSLGQLKAVVDALERDQEGVAEMVWNDPEPPPWDLDTGHKD